MCLTTNHYFPKISFRKIKVYKLVLVEDNKFYSPYQQTELFETPEEKFTFPRKTFVEGEYSVGPGMIHADRTLSDAIYRKTRLIANHAFISFKIIPAYIPPFTRYYLGNDGDICARKIKYEISD